MFPGIDGFHWTFGHILFLALFFAVALTILGTVVSAVWRTAHDFRTNKAIDFCWKNNFNELPENERRCRHELAGRVISRTCDNAFDCRECTQYAHYAVLPATGHVQSLGLNYPEDRLYHRGHTWVKPENDGCVSIGLDDFAMHLIGEPNEVTLPQVGEEIAVNQTAWRMKKLGKEVLIRAPLEGTVVDIGGPNADWYLQVRPRLDVTDKGTFRHLLRGPEVHGWIMRELERLQLQMRMPNTPSALADGGMLVSDLMKAVPEADWDSVLAETFLEP